MSDWVLWGTHPAYADGAPVAITGGTIGHCRSELRFRARIGWSMLAIAREGKRPWFPGDPQ